MNKLKVGIVGSRFAGDLHAEAYSRNPLASVTAVAAIDHLDEFSKKWNISDTYKDYRDMLSRPDIDLISVCVPNFLHHEVVLASAEAGKHVICEKPLAISVKEAREMIRICRKKQVKLMYAEDWCFAPALMRAREIIREGGIGEILYVKAKEVHNGTHSPFAKNRETCGGGALIHLGIHPIGWLIHLLGDNGKNPVIEVVGKVNSGLEGNYVHKDNSGEDWGVGILKFRNGVHGFVEGNYITTGGMDDKVEIYGSEGVIKADLTFGSPLEVYSRPGHTYAVEKADNTLGWTRPAVDEFYNLGYVHEIEYFVKCILDDRDPMWGVNGESGLSGLEIIEALYRSSLEGKTIPTGSNDAAI